MKEINRTYKRAGIFLLLLGILDLSVLLFCLATEHYYSSNFNIFAIIAGIFLIAGSVKTARIMRWLSPFIAVVAVGFYSIIVLSKPLDLIIVQLRLITYVTLVDFTASLFFIGVLFWVYRQLSSEESISALSKAGYKTGKPLSAVIAGVVIVIIAAIGSYIMLTGEAAEKAKSLAAEKAGNNYRFYINSIKYSGDHGSAVVTVYNNQMITNLVVEW